MIKQYIYITLLFCTCYNLGNSQIELGIKGGYTNAWPDYGDLVLPEGAGTSINGFNISVFVGKYFENRVGLSINPGFVKRGAACIPGWQPSFDGDAKVFLNYFELPIMIHKKIELGVLDLTMTPGLGYGLSYLSSARIQEEITISGQTEIYEFPVGIGDEFSDTYLRYDHGFHLNLRLNKKLPANHSIFFESSYYYGMTDYDPFNPSRNRSLNFNLGFGYAFGKR